MPGELKIGRVYRWTERSRQPYVAIDVDRLVTWKAGVLQVVDSPEEVEALLERQVEGEPPVGELLAAWGIDAARFDRELLEVMRPRIERVRAEFIAESRGNVRRNLALGLSSGVTASVLPHRAPDAGARVIAPLAAVRCAACGEEKPWLRRGERCAACAAPKGALVRREEHDASEVERVEEAPPQGRREEEAVMATTKFGGRKPNEWEEGLSSEALVEWREKHGLTRTALARLLGTGCTQITTWENGRAPNAAHQERIRELIAGPPPGEDEEPEDEEDEEGGDDQEEIDEPEPAPRRSPRNRKRARAAAPQLPAAVEPAPAPLPSWRALALGVLARAARGAAALANELERRAGGR